MTHLITQKKLIEYGSACIDLTTLAVLDVLDKSCFYFDDLHPSFKKDYELLHKRISGASYKEMSEEYKVSKRRVAEMIYRSIRRISWHQNFAERKFDDRDFEVLSDYEYKYKKIRGLLSGNEFSLSQVEIIKGLSK